MPIARIRTIFTGVAGSPWYSNMFFTDPGDGSTAESDAIAVDAFWDALAGVMTDDVDWSIEPLVPIYDETTGNLVAQRGILAHTGGGTEVAPTLPWTTQGLIRTRTAGIVNNRSVHGRIFVPGPSEASNDVGVPVSGYRTTLQTAIDALLETVTTELVVWARPFEGDPEAVPPKPARAGSSHPVVSADTWSQWAVLRSRRD